jgi:FAD/FMN-containing dehydrogenase
MRRRSMLKGIAGLAFLAGAAPVLASQATEAAAKPLRRRVRPYEPGWPTAAEWQKLRDAVGGRLEPVTPPLVQCAREPDGRLCAAALKDLQNPFFIQDQAGGTQSAGWIDGWTSAPSVYAVVPESAADIAASVNYAREKNLRLVVKGGAHSYLGQSNAPDSLMIWTRRLDKLELHDAFVPQGCEGKVKPQQAVSVGSGAKFIQLYDFVTTRHGRYVQGGGCTSVGVGGHVQTGGFGSFSKYGGLVAASLLEAEIVTADGEIRIANACLHPDLFWALKGGGAGFGITTRLTLATRPLPDRFGFYGWTLAASSDAAFRRLIEVFCRFAKDALINPHWGEQVSVNTDNRLEFAMVFQGLSDDAARHVWQPFQDWVANNGAEVRASDLQLISMPARNWWDFDYLKQHLPDTIIVDERPNAAPGRFWWSGTAGEVGIFLSGYESVWLPEKLLDERNRKRLGDALFAASRHHAVSLHFNKGLAGADPARRAEARATSIHPGAIDAFALAIIAGGQKSAYPGVLGHEPDLARARGDAKKITAAMATLRRVAPDSGSYSSEMSFFAKDWRRDAWGPHYHRLLATKKKYDPEGLFTGHHQVGSEFWSADGFTQIR